MNSQAVMRHLVLACVATVATAWGRWRFREEISPDFDWAKGTTWNWNNWRHVTLKHNGAFIAPTPECSEPNDECRWGAYDGYIWIQWGDSGLHRVSASRGNTFLSGARYDGDECQAAFVKKEEPEPGDEDLYDVLGLDEDATDAQIKRAYRKLSIKYHPDKNPGDAAAARKFNSIREANEILGDPDKRILYDTGGLEAVKEAIKEDQQNAGGQMMDPFAAFFGGGQQRGGNQNDGAKRLKAKRGPNFEAQLEVSLEDSYNGGSVNTNINRRVVCRNCRNKNTGKCASCGRCPNEVKMVQMQMAPGFVVNQQQEVPSKEKCKEETTTLKAVIEKGMNDGASITFERMSEQKPGMIPGDVVFKVKVKRHPRFQRRGNDLHMEMTISLGEALLGFEKKIVHLDGREVTIKEKGVTGPYDTKRIPQEGMPHHDVPSQKGDLFVKMKVNFPRQMTAEQIKFVKTSGWL
jgi:DnaJ-class molecular chaperone